MTPNPRAPPKDHQNDPLFPNFTSQSNIFNTPPTFTSRDSPTTHTKPQPRPADEKPIPPAKFNPFRTDSPKDSPRPLNASGPGVPLRGSSNRPIPVLQTPPVPRSADPTVPQGSQSNTNQNPLPPQKPSLNPFPTTTSRDRSHSQNGVASITPLFTQTAPKTLAAWQPPAGLNLPPIYLLDTFQAPQLILPTIPKTKIEIVADEDDLDVPIMPRKFEPFQQQIFLFYFGLADRHKTGSINTADGTLFLSYSGLTKPILSQIWTTACGAPTTTVLDKNQFIIALSLVALAQSSQPTTLEAVTSAPYIPLPQFQGIPLPAGYVPF